MSKYTVFFDGQCPFCIGWVKFIIDRDGKNVFNFASLQSETAKQMLKSEGIDLEGTPTMIVKHDELFYFGSEAVLKITEGLSGIWHYGKHLRSLPFSIRNRLYHWIAARRYKLFGKKEKCWIPDDSLKTKFLDFPTSE